MTALVGWCGWTQLSPGKPNIAGYERPGAPHQSHKAGGVKCYPWNLYRLPPPKRAVQAEACKDAEDAEKAGAETLDYSARSANASEQALLIAYYQSRVMLGQTFATVGAFIAAGIAAWFAKRAADEMKNSADAAAESNRLARLSALADNRPWIEIEEITLPTPVAFRGDNAEITLRYKLRNHGNSPAQHVSVVPRAGEWGNVDGAIKILADERTATARHVSGMFSTYIFPNGTHTEQIMCLASIKHLSENDRENFGSRFNATVFGVVRYENPHSEMPRVHQTGFIIRIIPAGHVKPPAMRKSASGMWLIGPTELKIDRWPQGWYAD